MADEEDKLNTSEQKKEDWMNSKWRPMMGWMYMLVCTMDFVLFPILWSLLQSISHGSVNSQWQPLTLQGAGLFHIAMGAVIGVSAYGRTQEKLNGANNGGIQLPPNAGTTYIPPGQANLNNQSGMSGGFGNGNSTVPTTGFGSGSTAFGAPSTGGFGNSSNFSSPTPIASTGFSTPVPASTGFGSGVGAKAQAVTGFGGKPAPAPQQDPVL